MKQMFGKSLNMSQISLTFGYHCSWNEEQWMINLILHPLQLEEVRLHHPGPLQSHPCV